MVVHAHILDTATSQDVSFEPSALQDRGPVTQTHRIADELARVVTLNWNPVTPGQAHWLKKHYEETQAGSFEINLVDGTQIVCIYRDRTQVTQRRGGFGTARAVVEEVRSWD
ncbi:MAG: hypothetical protein KDB80_18640 [Planctomycetes bacterium]|nr:hypothetical protein [Planctomycetota bacterium]